MILPDLEHTGICPSLHESERLLFYPSNKKNSNIRANLNATLRASSILEYIPREEDQDGEETNTNAPPLVSCISSTGPLENNNNNNNLDQTQDPLSNVQLFNDSHMRVSTSEVITARSQAKSILSMMKTGSAGKTGSRNATSIGDTSEIGKGEEEREVEAIEKPITNDPITISSSDDYLQQDLQQQQQQQQQEQQQQQQIEEKIAGSGEITKVTEMTREGEEERDRGLSQASDIVENNIHGDQGLLLQETGTDFDDFGATATTITSTQFNQTLNQDQNIGNIGIDQQSNTSTADSRSSSNKSYVHKIRHLMEPSPPNLRHLASSSDTSSNSYNHYVAIAKRNNPLRNPALLPPRLGHYDLNGIKTTRKNPTSDKAAKNLLSKIKSANHKMALLVFNDV